MPSYTGTIRCSHCYESGHNKRGCPGLTGEIKESYERQARCAERYRSGEFDHKLRTAGDVETNEAREWNVNYHTNRAEEARKQYLKRTKIDLATGKKVTNKAAKAERMKSVTCGYCKDRGHTRRVCPAVKEDYQVYKALSEKYKQAAYAKLQELNVNIGSMVFTRRWVGGEYRNTMYLVTAFDMRNVDYHNRGAACVKLSSPQGYGDYWLCGAQIEGMIEEGKAHASATPIVLQPSALNTVKLIKEAFPTSDERPYCYGRYGSDEDVGKARESLGIPTPL
jgi:hypothetical protein